MKTYPIQIIDRIVDLYPDSEHVKTLGLINTDDALKVRNVSINCTPTN